MVFAWWETKRWICAVDDAGVVGLGEGLEGRFGRRFHVRAALVVCRLVGFGTAVDGDCFAVRSCAGGKAAGDGRWEAGDCDLVIGEVCITRVCDQLAVTPLGGKNSVENLICGFPDVWKEDLFPRTDESLLHF